MKNEKISDGFISHFAAQVTDPDRAQMYTQILSPPQAPSAQTSSPREEVVLCLQRWRDKTEGTYTMSEGDPQQVQCLHWKEPSGELMFEFHRSQHLLIMYLSVQYARIVLSPNM